MVLEVIGNNGDWVWVTREDEILCSISGPNHGRLFPASEILAAFQLNASVRPHPPLTLLLLHALLLVFYIDIDIIIVRYLSIIIANNRRAWPTH